MNLSVLKTQTFKHLPNNGIAQLLTLACLFFVTLSPSQSFASAGFFDPGRGSSGNSSASGGLTPTSDEFDGGAITVGSTGQAVTLFRNEGGRPVSIKGVKLYPSSTVSASVSSDGCSSNPLPGGAECPIIISVKGLQTGAWRVEILINHDGRSQLTTATLTGTIDAGSTADDQNALSDIDASPSELDFGTLSSSQPLVKSIILRNITPQPLSIKEIKINSSSQSGIRLDHDCDNLIPSQACLATVVWAPQQEGKSDGVIVINHTGPSRVATIPITGEFTPDDAEAADIFPNVIPGRGLLVSSQEEIDFESGVENESSISVSLVNIGDSDLKINDISLSGTDNGLSILRKGCTRGSVLRPIEACPLTLRWSPVREGSILDDIQIDHDGARGILVVPVKGSATNAISKDSQAIVVHEGVVQREYRATDSLSGFTITSKSEKSAIISGPGGSRIVKHNKPIAIGGVEWDVKIKHTSVEFKNGSDIVNLLFDHSLSSSTNSNSSSSSTSTSEE